MESCPPGMALVTSRPIFDADSSHDIYRPSSTRISGDIPPLVPLPPRNTPLAGTSFGETRTLHNVPASPLSYAGPTIPVAAVVVEKIFSDKFEGGLIICRKIILVQKNIFSLFTSQLLMTPSVVVVISRGQTYGIGRIALAGPVRPPQHLRAATSHLYRWNQRLI